MDRPLFFLFCKCDGDDMEIVCPNCIVRKECETYLTPIANALEKAAEEAN